MVFLSNGGPQWTKNKQAPQTPNSKDLIRGWSNFPSNLVLCEILGEWVDELNTTHKMHRLSEQKSYLD